MAMYRIKFDKKRCIACDACLVHCKVKNKVPVGISLNHLFAQGPIADKDGNPSAKLKYQACMDCKKPECVSACPTGSMYKRDDGIVIVDHHRCIGCRYCMQACPFSVPGYQWESPLPKVQKCTMCFERQKIKTPKKFITSCEKYGIPNPYDNINERINYLIDSSMFSLQITLPNKILYKTGILKL